MTLARRHFLLMAGFAAVPAASRHAFGQSYPTRPVRWIVPYPAGGTTDLIARLMGQWLTERLGKPVIIENRPGGGTNIGAQAAIQAPPDGHTLLFTVATHALNPSLYKTLPFDFQRDIAPVSGLAELPLVLVVNPAVPATTLAEFIAHAKANPGKVNVASFGVRTISHLALALLQASTGIDVVHVPYAGGATMMTDLLSGRIEAGIDALPNSLPQIKGGGIRALAILPAARTAALPNLPTVGETIPDFEVSTWSGVGVPRGTPADIIERLNREINAGLADPAITSRFAEVGAVPLRFSSSEMGALIARDAEKWARVVQAAGMKPE